MNIFRRLGLKVITFEEWKTAVELPYMRFYRKFTDAPKEEIDRLYGEEIVLVEKPKPFPGVKEILEYLHFLRIKMIILSSNPQKILDKEVKEYGFQNFFIAVEGNVHNKKEMILKLLNKHRLVTSLPEENLIVGDMVHDIEAGKEAKALTVAITWGAHSREKLVTTNPNFLISNILEIKNIVERYS
jgi:phosphoglycolate phosphatase-like HAD superfamily hydrolase